MSKHKLQISKKQVVTVLGVVGALLIAAGAGGLLWWLQHSQAPQTPAATASPLPKNVNDVQTLRLQGNYDEAQKKTDDALNNSKTSTDEKYMLYIQQGSTFADQGNFQAAADSYTKAEGVKETYEVATLLATTYTKAGSKDKAIEYYKKAITLIPPNYVLGESDKATFEQDIRNLGGQP